RRDRHAVSFARTLPRQALRARLRRRDREEACGGQGDGFGNSCGRDDGELRAAVREVVKTGAPALRNGGLRSWLRVVGAAPAAARISSVRSFPVRGWGRTERR